MSIEELLRSADVLSLHVALAPETRGIIGPKELDMMPPESLLVNTARAELVDLPAVVERLRSGRLGGAAFDVFDREPPPPEHPLLSAPNVVLTPHASWYSTESGPELVRRACLAMQTVLAGGRPGEGVLVEGNP